MKKSFALFLLVYFSFTVLAQKGEPQTISSEPIPTNETTELIVTESSYTKPKPIEIPCFEIEKIINTPSQLDKYFKNYQAYQFDFAKFDKFVKSQDYSMVFSFCGFEKQTFNLQAYNLRTKDCKMMVNGKPTKPTTNENETLSEDTPFFHTTRHFKGFTNNNLDNFVRFNIDEDGFNGIIFNAENESYKRIEPLKDVYKAHNWATDENIDNIIIVYDPNDYLGQNDGWCPVTNTYPAIGTSGNTSTLAPINKGLTDLCSPRFFEIATDADFEYYSQYGPDINDVNNRILDQLSITEGIYTYYFNLTFAVVSQNVYTVEDTFDPDAGLDNDAIPSNVINKFRQHWNANHATIDRDIAILFSREDLGNADGVAFLGTTCSNWAGYAVVATFFSEPRVIAHEIGHHFNSEHCTDYNTAYNATCGSSSTSTIMCPSNTGGKYIFADETRTAILNGINNANCLGNIGVADLLDDWIKTWTNQYDKQWIGPWHLKEGDTRISGDFDGDDDEEIICMSPNGNWSTIIDYSCNNGADWYHQWSNMGNGEIYTWLMHENDRYFVGDFDGDSKDDLLSISHNENWATIQTFNAATNSWSYMWSNFGNGKINNWIMNDGDKFKIADFDGDGMDEILCMAQSGWSHLQDYNGSSFNLLWTNGGNGIIGGVAVNTDERYIPGKFTVTNRDELLTWVNTWVTVLRFNNSTNNWDWIWSQYGANNFASMYILPLNNEQLIFSGNFDQDDREEVLNINNTWSATADYNGTTFTQNWNNGGTGLFDDWYLAGDDKYLVVKASEQNEDHVIGFQYVTTGWWLWQNTTVELAEMYRGVEVDNKLADENQKIIESETKKADKELIVSMYPNPTFDYININLHNGFDYNKTSYVKVTNSLGQTVLTQQLSDKNVLINVAELSSGLYNVSITNKKGKKICSKNIVIK